MRYIDGHHVTLLTKVGRSGCYRTVILKLVLTFVVSYGTGSSKRIRFKAIKAIILLLIQPWLPFSINLSGPFVIDGV